MPPPEDVDALVITQYFRDLFVRGIPTLIQKHCFLLCGDFIWTSALKIFTLLIHKKEEPHHLILLATSAALCSLS